MEISIYMQFFVMFMEKTIEDIEISFLEEDPKVSFPYERDSLLKFVKNAIFHPKIKIDLWTCLMMFLLLS